MKKFTLLLALVISVILFSSCSLHTINNDSRFTVESFEFGEIITQEDIETDLSSSDYCQTTETGSLPEITSDTKINDFSFEVDFNLMAYFYGVWTPDAQNNVKFVIGAAAEYDDIDFINNYGNICGLYCDDEYYYLICKNYISEYHKLIISKNDLNLAYFVDCYEESNSAEYHPQILRKTDTAEPYSVTGEINGFSNSILQHKCGYFSPYPYVEIEYNGHYYRNECQYFENGESLYVLNSYSQNSLSFTSNFVEISPNDLSIVGGEIYTITYELCKNTEEEWVLLDFTFKGKRDNTSTNSVLEITDDSFSYSYPALCKAYKNIFSDKNVDNNIESTISQLMDKNLICIYTYFTTALFRIQEPDESSEDGYFLIDFRFFNNLSEFYKLVESTYTEPISNKLIEGYINLGEPTFVERNGLIMYNPNYTGFTTGPYFSELGYKIEIIEQSDSLCKFLYTPLFETISDERRNELEKYWGDDMRPHECEAVFENGEWKLNGIVFAF